MLAPYFFKQNERSQLSVSQALVNFDELFAQLKSPPIIINDVMESSEEEKETLKSLIYTRYNSDLLSNLPSCECAGMDGGDQTGVTGEYNIGVICNNCGTAVKSPIEQTIEPILWMRAPKGVRKLINPVVWTMLNNRFSKSSFKVIQWICDTTYRPQSKVPVALDYIQQAGIQRGYNYFIENFDFIMNTLFEMKDFALQRKGGRPPRDYLRELLARDRDCIFSDYLPLPNKSLLIIEETNKGTYVDPIVIGAIDAIQTIASIDNSMSQHSVRVKENRTIKTIVELSDFNDNYTRNGLAEKAGIFRKHVFGSRVHFSFRAVISSITDKHDYNEIHIPWGVATSVFRYHILNRLEKLGYTVNSALEFLNRHAKRYSPLLDQIFTDLIESSPDKRIPCTLGRNPSLHRSSLQLVGISQIRKDPEIATIGISILIVKGLNADFDGDEINCTLPLDIRMAVDLSHLDPHKSVFDLNEPRAVSNNLAIPKPVIASISNFMHKEEAPDPAKLRLMEELYM